VTTRRSDSRERILDIVTALFVANGYHATGINEISQAVGLGRGALYHHIGSKEQVLFDISMSLLDDAAASAAPWADTGLDPEEALRGLARSLLGHHADHGEGWQVAVRESRFMSEEHQARVREARRAFEAVWSGVLQRGAAAGRWRAVDPVDVRGILGMFNYTARWIHRDGRLSPEQIADRYVDLLLDGLRPR
jgi:AcrR family transcriptional regulator